MKTLNLRNVPDPLYQRIQARARQERRSITNQIVVLLEHALEASPEHVQEAIGYFKSRLGRQKCLALRLVREDRRR